MLVDFFKNLPWWLLYPGRALLAICGGYVSQNPQIFPHWAVLLGALVALWVIVAFVWHAINAWREHNQKQRLRLDPQLILIGCLLGALAMVTWQWWRGTPPDPRIAVLEAQIADLRNQPRGLTLNTQQPTASAAEQHRPLTRKEEEALDELSTLINTKGRAASKLADAVLGGTHPATGGLPEYQVPRFLRDKVQEVANVLEGLDVEIYRDILPPKTFYSNELLAALGASTVNRVDGPIYPFAQATQSYLNSINQALRIADEAKSTSVTQMALGTTEGYRAPFASAANNFKNWIDSFNARVAARRVVR